MKTTLTEHPAGSPATDPTRRRTRLVPTVAVAAALGLGLAACSGTANGPANPSGTAGAGSGNGAAYELVADTPAPSGDIDAFSWTLYAEPDSLEGTLSMTRVGMAA